MKTAIEMQFLVAYKFLCITRIGNMALNDFQINKTHARMCIFIESGLFFIYYLLYIYIVNVTLTMTK